jgi:hypothetical protein
VLERDHQEDELALAFPPAWCSLACKNSLSDKCLESCALKRDGSWFDPRPDVTITDLPRFPLKAFVEEMGPRERTLAIGLYTALLADQAQGRAAPTARRRTGHGLRLGGLSAEIPSRGRRAAAAGQDGQGLLASPSQTRSSATTPDGGPQVASHYRAEPDSDSTGAADASGRDMPPVSQGG